MLFGRLHDATAGIAGAILDVAEEVVEEWQKIVFYALQHEIFRVQWAVAYGQRRGRTADGFVHDPISLRLTLNDTRRTARLVKHPYRAQLVPASYPMLPVAEADVSPVRDSWRRKPRVDVVAPVWTH